jgi:protein CpxP
MNKLKFLSIVSIVLLFTNLALVGFIILRKPPHPRDIGPRNSIIEKLKLDENQVIEYDKLVEWHRSEIRKSDLDIMAIKNKLYTNLINGSSISIKDSLIRELTSVQAHIENTHYKHFEDIKILCHENQIHAFELLTQEIASLFSKPPNKGDKK